ncbi:ufm1-specific protease 2-like isoform X1 [Littorina saxatilis]|uniref:Ufm1-specific protease 2 n=1 Tax=Littorina saxatilis TaxID=31220 RepID=A0AAN9G770_9CAEN
MAEVSFPKDLKGSLEKGTWIGDGVHGYLIGQVWQGQAYVLNVWTYRQTSAEILVTEKDSCLHHLSGADRIIGVVFVTKSEDIDGAETAIVSLPLEVQTAVSGPLFVVCGIKNVLKQAEASFYCYFKDGNQLERLREHPEFTLFGSEFVTFQIKAQLSLNLQLDKDTSSKSERWGEKLNKVFRNLEGEASSGCYVYGVQGTDIFLSENDVIGTKEKIETVKDFYAFITSKQDSDTRHKKIMKTDKRPVMVDLYQQMSGTTGRFAKPTCAPAIQEKFGRCSSLVLTLPLDVVVDAKDSEPLTTLMERFSTAIIAQLRAMKTCVDLHRCKENEFHIPEPFHFSIPQRHTCITVVYPRKVPDEMLEKRRCFLHDKMCLGQDQPVFRRANARLFQGQLAAGGYIINPHIGLSPSAVQGGKTHLVQGNYAYHHYMQDHFDDDKWGCAYRSLQTIISWFRLQGYSDKPVPSHKEIQQALVTVGDKEASFVGSKKWIGSFEVSFVLDHLLGVTSKFISVSAGSELASKGRELAQHFDTQGTPIMIGGGVLAHTILGVDYSKVSGEIKFLILDPHYTGGEDLAIIQKEGWCGWKGINFWNATAHYNLCMPQRPVCF